MGNVKDQPPSFDDPLSHGTIGKRIWAARMKAGHTARQPFAKLVGVHYGTLDNIERKGAQPEAATLQRIAALVRFTVDELLTGKRGAAVAVSHATDHRGAEVVQINPIARADRIVLDLVGSLEPGSTIRPEWVAELRSHAAVSGGEDEQLRRSLGLMLTAMRAGSHTPASVPPPSPKAGERRVAPRRRR